MPPKKAKTVRIKEPEVSEDEEDDQKEAAALKKESGAQIVRNLLEKERISTPHPNTPFVKWAEWTCLHCDETYYPAQNYETTEKRDSDITSPIVKHFAKKHGSGPDSAYAEAAPNTYKLRDARHSEDGEILVPARVRRAFASNARGLWNVLTREYGVEPSRVLLFQIGLLWTKGYLAHDESHVPADAKARVKKLVEELKAAIAEYEGCESTRPELLDKELRRFGYSASSLAQEERYDTAFAAATAAAEAKAAKPAKPAEAKAAKPTKRAKFEKLVDDDDEEEVEEEGSQLVDDKAPRARSTRSSEKANGADKPPADEVQEEPSTSRSKRKASARP